MQLKFDANQQYQPDAIQAVMDLFDGQPRADTELHFSLRPSGFAVVPNCLDLTESDLLANLQTVQERNGVSPDQNLECITVGAQRVDSESESRESSAVPLRARREITEVGARRRLKAQ